MYEVCLVVYMGNVPWQIICYMLWPMHVNIPDGWKWTGIILMSAVSFLFPFNFCPLQLEDGDNMHNKADSQRRPDSRNMNKKIHCLFMSCNHSNQNCPRILIAEYCNKDGEVCASCIPIITHMGALCNCPRKSIVDTVTKMQNSMHILPPQNYTYMAHFLYVFIFILAILPILFRVTSIAWYGHHMTDI